MNNFTFEEINLMCIYNSGDGTRQELIEALTAMRGYLGADETELLELTDSALSKLSAMTDEAFAELELYPDFDSETMPMMSNLEFYSAMASYTATHLTDSWQRWTAFLTTASRLYKYPFHEQLMIFAQRPDATACAEYDLWNDTMRRYVRRGSKGIALVDNSREKPRLRYVFDISDTGLRKNSRHPFLWELRPEHEAAVAQALAEWFGAPPENNLAEQLESIAAQLVSEYWVEHKRDILDIVDGSFLEGYDEFNIGVQFRNAATVSITYSLLSRCGLEPEGYFDHEDFLSIFDFNTPEAVAALGTAVSQINQQVLRQIGITIQNYERAKFAERSVTHGEQPDLHQERRLSRSPT